MEQLQVTFFPPLPGDIEDEGSRAQRAPYGGSGATTVCRKTVEGPPGGRPASSCLEAGVVSKDHVLALFEHLSTMARYWSQSSRRGSHTRSKPMVSSPLTALGRGNRNPQKQTLLLLQEQILQWSLRRKIARENEGARHPEERAGMGRAFYSGRTATIQVNGQSSEVRGLPQAGLLEDSPLSPVPFLIFNANLVQRHIDSNGGAIAFVDDFTAQALSKSLEAAFKLKRLRGLTPLRRAGLA
ncbi:uncharacterized protein PV07_12620 [Cladophialophora immunda]|uniref:Reverse transcriptase domain-containing protein n=1 Tax=Cladophialophora immunda TaxID=569365 RepID=A0A0D1Z2Z9_9EURO|nr:uncharacterized protein PV07_12620 [Cladophialophora immunda]KIW21981.1 hypothetical protein PV07_12620 [Cladophialophora immunda]